MAYNGTNPGSPYFRSGAFSFLATPVRIKARMETVRKDAAFRAGSEVRKEIPTVHLRIIMAEIRKYAFSEYRD